GRKYETKIIKDLKEENQKLMHQLKEYKKSMKKLSKQNDEIIKESSLKDNMIANLKIENLMKIKEEKDKIIEEMRELQKLSTAAPNQNPQQTPKPPSRL
uniref:Uncharacterized protein n=1 Tax=Panagrolaimus sp. PS1159 TaxID=55785 RepID=A0AC35F470_9BILA